MLYFVIPRSIRSTLRTLLGFAAGDGQYYVLCDSLRKTRKGTCLWEMSAEIYRQTKLGDSLVSALEVLVESDKITADLAIKVLSEVRYPSGRLSAACMRFYVMVSDFSVLCSLTRCAL